MPRSFEELFACGPGYSLWTAGTWNGAGKLLPAIPPERQNGDVIPAHWQGHFDGSRALIVSPTLQDKSCLFGVIDVDPVKKADRGPKLAQELFELLHSKELPFAVCESKSNGAHAYIFFDHPELASEVSKMLTHIVEKLDIKKRFNANIDIRPSHSRDGSGTQIQLPYFGTEAIAGATSPRAMLLDGVYLTRDEFVDWCNTHAIVDWPSFRKQVSAQLGAPKSSHTLINNIASYEDKAKEGPPCFEALMLEEEGTEHEGHRDDMMTHLSARLPMMFPDDWKEMLHNKNYSMATPLKASDIDRIIRGQENQGYGLLCQRDFVQPICNREVCKVRRFGIMARNTVSQVVGFEIVKLVKFKPPEGDDQNKYPVHIYLENQPGYVNTNQDSLLSFPKFAADVFHQYKFHVPPMSAKSWHPYINSLVGREGDIFFEEPMPREMTLQGRFERAARDYLRSRIHTGDELQSDAFQRGQIVWDKEKRCLVMDAGVFADELRRQLKEVGLTTTRVMDMFHQSELLAKGTRPWKALYQKNGIVSSLMHFVPRHPGDGQTYEEAERDTVWFVEPEDQAF